MSNGSNSSSDSFSLSAEDEGFIRRGNLQKQGKINRAWQLRWFVLKRTYMSYSRKPDSKKPQGVIVIKDIVECSIWKRQYILVVVPGRVFSLWADDPKIADQWFEAIQTCRQNLRERPVPQSPRRYGISIGQRASVRIGEPIQFIQFHELEIGSKIGEGAFGAVYQGRWNGTNVAIKEISKLKPEQKLEIEKEAALLQSLRHQNIVLYYGSVSSPDGSKTYLVTELLEGGDLYSLLHENKYGKLRPKEIVLMAQDIASGLVFLHSQNPKIVHRDLKSPNILLDRSQKTAKIADFGLAKTMTTSHLQTLAGTLHWMAPEVLQGHGYNEKVDVYGFGMLLYELVMNEIPFADATSHANVLSNIVAGQRPSLVQCPFEWQEIISKCWHADPASRPTMSEVVNMIGKIKQKY